MNPSAEARLDELGIVLPTSSQPMALYVPLITVGRLVFLSGHGPTSQDGPRYVGQFGRELPDSEAVQATRLTVLNLLSTMRHGLASLDSINRILTLRCYVVAAAVSDAPRIVADAAQKMFGEIFGSANAGSCTVVGISETVLSLPVTVDLVAELNPSQQPTPG